MNIIRSKFNMFGSEVETDTRLSDDIVRQILRESKWKGASCSEAAAMAAEILSMRAGSAGPFAELAEDAASSLPEDAGVIDKKDLEKAFVAIDTGMFWSKTREGHRFWSNVHSKLYEKIA